MLWNKLPRRLPSERKHRGRRCFVLTKWYLSTNQDEAQKIRPGRACGVFSSQSSVGVLLAEVRGLRPQVFRFQREPLADVPKRISGRIPASGGQSLRFGFEQFFPVPRRAFTLIGNDARDGRRNPGISRRSPRFRSFV